MKVEVSSDLQGLGASQGPPVRFVWSLANLTPPLVPWLAVLLLLALKPNRCAPAWWIWAPLGGWFVLCAVVEATLPGLGPLRVTEAGLSALSSIGFGIAGLWLLAPSFGRWNRWLSFGGMALALVALSLLAFATNLEGDAGVLAWDWVRWWLLLLWGVTGIVFATAVRLTGLACRRRYSASCAAIGLLAALLLSWTLAVVLLACVVQLFGGGWEWGQATIAGVVAALLSFAALLPFLILSFANSFHRERLKTLLRVTNDKQLEPGT